MFKKILTVTALVLIAITIAIYSITLKKKNTDAGYIGTKRQELFLSFSEAVAMSDCAAAAEFLSYKNDNGQIEYTFQVKEVLRGEIPEKTIHLFDTKGISNVENTDYVYETGKDIFNTNEEYVLIMNKNDSLFFEYPHYTLIANLYIPIKNADESTMYEQRLSDISKKEIDGVKSFDVINTGIDGIKSFVRSAKISENNEGQRYTTASDFPTIIKESDFVLEVKVSELMVEGTVANSNTYFCDVVNLYKGDNIVTVEGRDDILITFMKGKVTVGKTYMVMINRIGEKSAIYTQSSLNSVITNTNTKAIAEVKRLVSESK